ncbi:MAG: hypothetical protein OXG85_03300 [Chloroflexi bacterium]|nr:hypothetical protein [Chloroflexota bacterium]
MIGAELAVPGHTALRVLVFALYILAGAYSFKCLFPNLSPSAKRIALGFIFAQGLVSILALEFRSMWEWEGWLWGLNVERNIPTTIASTQLAMVFGVGLTTAWLGRERSIGHRLYLAAYSLVFLFFAFDEYHIVHEGIPNWRYVYGAVGIGIVLFAIIMALRADRRERAWHGWLAAGPTVMAMGAIAVDSIQHPGFGLSPDLCADLGLDFLGRCQIHALEETLEFLGAWFTLVAVLGLLTATRLRPRAALRRALYAWPLLWLLLILHYPVFLLLEVPLTAQRASVLFDNGGPKQDVELHGYRVEKTQGAVAVQFYSYARYHANFTLGYSVHLVDQLTGQSIASSDKNWAPWVGPRLGPGYRHAHRERLVLRIPPDAPKNRALWLVATLWSERDGAYEKKAIVSSDHRLLSETQVILSEMVLPAESTAPIETNLLALFDKGFSLEVLALPAAIRAGDTLRVAFGWRAEADSSDELIQFLHFVSEDSGAQWGHDQQPLGARLPTRLWYAGMADREVWEIPVSADLAPGPYAVYTGLYRSTNHVRLAVTGADRKPFADARVPLGKLLVEG